MVDLEKRFEAIKVWYEEHTNRDWNSISPESWEELHKVLYHIDYKDFIVVNKE